MLILTMFFMSTKEQNVYFKHISINAMVQNVDFKQGFALVIWCRMCSMSVLSMFFISTMVQNVDFKHIFQ